MWHGNGQILGQRESKFSNWISWFKGATENVFKNIYIFKNQDISCSILCILWLCFLGSHSWHKKVRKPNCCWCQAMLLTLISLHKECWVLLSSTLYLPQQLHGFHSMSHKYNVDRTWWQDHFLVTINSFAIPLKFIRFLICTSSWSQRTVLMELPQNLWNLQ